MNSIKLVLNSFRKRPSSTAVSYTHLDVYKRQGWGCAVKRQAVCCSASGSRLLLKCWRMAGNPRRMTRCPHRFLQPGKEPFVCCKTGPFLWIRGSTGCFYSRKRFRAVWTRRMGRQLKSWQNAGKRRKRYGYRKQERICLLYTSFQSCHQ